MGDFVKRFLAESTGGSSSQGLLRGQVHDGLLSTRGLLRGQVQDGLVPLGGVEHERLFVLE